MGLLSPTIPLPKASSMPDLDLVEDPSETLTVSKPVLQSNCWMPSTLPVVSPRLPPPKLGSSFQRSDLVTPPRLRPKAALVRISTPPPNYPSVRSFQSPAFGN
eukprot:Platyproteum_vivax@DN4819_c0_g1_i2.p1